MKEINRRVFFTEENGIACDPISLTGCDAEIQVDDDGKIVYLHGQWCLEGDGIISTEVTTESIYDAYMAMHQDVDDETFYGKLVPERDRIKDNCTITDIGKYETYLDELEQMILKEIADHGYSDEEEE